jgi:DnaJ-domain-containing protein 1
MFKLKLNVSAVVLVCASIFSARVEANAACFLPDGSAGTNIAYRYAGAYIKSLIYADIALKRVNTSQTDPVAAIAENELAARDFECAATSFREYEQYPTDHSSPEAEKQSELARKTAAAVRENYLALADIQRRIAKIVTGELDIRGQGALSADIQDRMPRVFIYTSTISGILVDPKPDSSGSIRLKITTQELDNLVFTIDEWFGNRARTSLQNLKDENLPAVDQSVSLLRLWLTAHEHSARTQTGELELVSSKDADVKKQPEPNNFLFIVGKGILGLILVIVVGGITVYGFYCIILGLDELSLFKRRILSVRCCHCNSRTRNNNKTCDACKARMDYEEAKKTEYERQNREARIKAEECRKREDAEAREKQKRDEDARRKAKEQEEGARAQEKRKREEEAKDRKSSENEAGGHTTEGKGFDPYEVLRVNRRTSKDEMKVAYYRLLKQYHPDKVSHLGKEFQKMAEEKTRAINRAYEMLTSV